MKFAEIFRSNKLLFSENKKNNKNIENEHGSDMWHKNTTFFI